MTSRRAPELVDRRVQRRLDALVFAVRSPKPDALARHVEALARRAPDAFDAARAAQRRSLEQLELAILAAIRRAVSPGSPPAQVLAVARAVWQLIDRPEDAEARRALAGIGRRLADRVLAGEELEAAAQAVHVATWSEAHQRTLAQAVRRVLASR